MKSANNFSSSNDGPNEETTVTHLAIDGITIAHTVPVDQPEQVHQLTPVLFSRYEVEGGTVKLGGCLLEDAPFIRVEGRQDLISSPAETLPVDDAEAIDTANDPDARLSRRPSPYQSFDPVWLVLDREGEIVDPDRALRLGLDFPQPTDGPPSYLAPSDLHEWIQLVRDKIDSACQQANIILERIDVVWCKRASGKIVVSIGAQSATIPFSGWAKSLSNGESLPPPFRCSRTNRTGYRITAAPNGQMTVPEALRKRAVSGRIALETDLVACESSGLLCLPDQLSQSELSHRRVMATQLVECTQCGQTACLDEVDNGICMTCQALTDIKSNDELQNLLKDYPSLSKFASWRFAQSETYNLFAGRTWLKRILVTVNRQSNEIQHLATGTRLSQKLQPLRSSEWSTIIK